MPKKVTKITCEIIATHEFNEDGIAEIIGELTNRYGGNLNIASVSCKPETIEVDEPTDRHEGIYLALEDDKICPCCGRDLSLPYAITLSVPDKPLGTVRATVLPDNTLSVRKQHYLDEKKVEDVHCVGCKESFMDRMYNFQYTGEDRVDVVANLVHMIQTKGF